MEETMSDNERKYCVMIGPGVFVVEKKKAFCGNPFGRPPLPLNTLKFAFFWGAFQQNQAVENPPEKSFRAIFYG